jgi:hypothetical protein
MRFAQREFGGAGDGVARVMAILEWIHRNVDYVAGVSNAETTAERTFVDRAGVCRDFTHLGITLSGHWAFPRVPSAPMRFNWRPGLPRDLRGVPRKQLVADRPDATCPD